MTPTLNFFSLPRARAQGGAVGAAHSEKPSWMVVAGIEVAGIDAEMRLRAQARQGVAPAGGSAG